MSGPVGYPCTVVPFSAGPVLLPPDATTISLCMENASFRMGRFVIEEASTIGGTADWVVHDIRIDGKSQFVQCGDAPGDMFREDMLDSFVRYDTCPAGGSIEIDAIYLGDAIGVFFTGRLEGVVICDDPAMTPLHLRVLVKVDGKRSSVVVGILDGRSSATSNGAS